MSFHRNQAIAAYGRRAQSPVHKSLCQRDDCLAAIRGEKYTLALDGKGAASEKGFEDPETHEKGVNNQMFRAFGCSAGFRGTDKQRPIQWSFTWDSLRPGMPAWLITISGDNLDKDGDATITFDRAGEHITRDANGGVQRDMTFRIDPSPQSHNVLPAKIKDGVRDLTHDIMTLQAEGNRAKADSMLATLGA